MSFVTHVQIAVVASISTILLYYVFTPPRHSLRSPPGPRPLPILGNILQMTLEFPEKRFAEWRKIYGDVIFLRLFNSRVLVLNSVTVARELLEKRSAKYSERPHSILTVDMLGWEHDIGLIPYTDEFRKHRRWMHTHFFTKTSLDAIADVQRKETVTLLKQLLQDPVGFDEHIHRYAASMMLKHLYGHDVQSAYDEYLHIITKAVEETMSSSAPGASVVDFIPILQYLPAWLPGARFKRRAAEVKRMVREAACKTYELAERKSHDIGCVNAVLPSLIRAYSNMGTLDVEREEIMMFGVSVYGAGIDTTPVVIRSFLLAMILHPDAYARAQAEMDNVVGGDRLPTTDDRDLLPYLECLLKEVYRFAPPAPLAAPHATCEDDEYCGYYIPKDTTVIPNLWLMLHDADTYPDPDTFNPERFYGVFADQPDPRNIVFGFGRRICPGRRFADTGIWQVMATFIATFDVRKARDVSGAEITPAGTFSSGFLNHPHKFQCSIKPRSERAASLILGQ